MLRRALMALCMVALALGLGCNTKSGADSNNPDGLEYNTEGPAPRGGAPAKK